MPLIWAKIPNFRKVSTFQVTVLPLCCTTGINPKNKNNYDAFKSLEIQTSPRILEDFCNMMKSDEINIVKSNKPSFDEREIDPNVNNNSDIILFFEKAKCPKI